MLNLFFIALTLTVASPITTFAKTVIVKPGDTLSGIAYKHNVSLRKLIRINGIKDSNNLEIGQSIIIPDSKSYNEKQYTTYTVNPGDTLNDIALRFRTSKEELTALNKIENLDYLFAGQVLKVAELQLSIESSTKNYMVVSGDTIASIAKKYKSTEKDIILLNKIKNPNNIFPGQTLLIPKKNNLDQEESIRSNKAAIKPDYHLLAPGESLYSIARQYKIPFQTILEINKFDQPNNLQVGKKIYLKDKFSKTNQVKMKAREFKIKTKESDWREYGPLKIDWTKWQPLGGSYVTPTLNKEGKALYLAINCSAKKINATGANGTWKNWIEPIEQFEFDLIRDLCKQKKI